MQPPDEFPGAGVQDRTDFSLDPLYGWDTAVAFRHSGWKNDRRRVYDALLRTDQPLNRRTDFASCGQHAYVYQSIDDPDVYTLGGSTCHDRFCLPCARERSRVIATNVLDKLESEHARFLTLTLQSTTEPLCELLTKLTTSFTALRRSRLWRNKVTGGVAFLEIKWFPGTNRWHPHLHCLVQGRYLPKDELSKTWLQITATSHIVDIHFANDNNHVTHYITKYASKPLDHSVVLVPDRLDEAVLALKGKRLCMTFGTWRGFKLTESLEHGKWVNLGTLAELIANATAGHPDACRALNILSIEYAPSTRAPPLITAAPASSFQQAQQSFVFPIPTIRPSDASGTALTN